MVKSGSLRLRRSLEVISWRMLGCEPAVAGWLLAIQLWLALLWFYYQGYGLVRGAILLGLLGALLLLRTKAGSRTVSAPAGATFLPQSLCGLLITVLILDVCLMIVSSALCFETGKIPMDEGVTTWRAARLLWQGEDPYGQGALVDIGAYHARAAERSAAGIGTPLTGSALSSDLARYDATLDPHARHALHIEAAGKDGAGARETRLYGYKYGPVILLVTALTVPFGISAAVLVLNGLACFALYGTAWQLLKRIASPQVALAGAAMLALLLDRHITRNYIDRSATDVWALLFGSLAVWALMARRPLSCAAAVAFAIGCKSIPGLLFAPLLFRFRSPGPPLVCAGLTFLLYLPWLIWDPSGVLYNVFLWPFFMSTDYTSWQFFAPSWMSIVARVAIICALGALWTRYILGHEQRLFWTLAVSSTLVLLAGGFLRNGYVPWASIFAVMAVAEAFGPRRAVTTPEIQNVRLATPGRYHEPAESLVLARESL